MTVSTLPHTATALQQVLLPALDMAAAASREAHEAARALTDTVLACQTLPAEIYQYAPDLTHTTRSLVAATRALTAATGAATTHPTPERLHALNLATTDVLAATAAARTAASALQAAAAWYAGPAAIPATGV